MQSREVRFLKLNTREVPTGGVLFNDGRFSFDVCVHISDDDGGLILGGREIRVIEFEGADVVQLKILTGMRQTPVRRERADGCAETEELRRVKANTIYTGRAAG